MNDVCLAMERIGFVVRMGYCCTQIDLLRDDAPIWVRIVEKSVVGNAEERGDLSKAIRGRYGLVGTGRIELTITQYGGGSTTFRDRGGQSLEQEVPEIVKAIERRHADAVKYKKEVDARHDAHHAAERQREKELEDRAAEQKRREDLIRRAADWDNAQRIRAFVSALRERFGSGERPPDDFEEWAAWALQVADEIDQNSRLAHPRLKAI
jgi:hypothetical protein